MTRSIPIFLAASLLALGALAQPRRPRRTRVQRTPTVDASAPTQNLGPELISVPVADIDRMMRQMRVWLFNPPAGASGFGLSQMGAGRRLWVLLPSCRQPNPDDPRDPCPVDRVIIEAVGAEGGASVNGMDPVGVAPSSESRRVQSFVVPAGVPRVRVKLMALRAQVRYEAVVDADRLVELPAPVGNSGPGGFSFDLSQYPAR